MISSGKTADAAYHAPAALPGTPAPRSWQNAADRSSTGGDVMHHTSRRDFFALLAALPAAGLLPVDAAAQAKLPTRRIPGRSESLPVIGLGSSKVVEEIAKNGEDPLRQVLRALVAHGGRVVDTWPRNADNDGRFGKVINEPEFRDRLFVTTKIDQVGKEAGIAQFRQAQRLYGRQTLDLVQIFSLTDLDTHWPSLRGWKESGEARYIGVTVSEQRRHADLEAFLRRERPDFMQTNYSITERQSEERLLPLAADRGVAVLINRPFMNGALFRRLEGTALPPWAAEFGCTSWAQFSLKYILANPNLTGVLTETSNPKHMAENAMAATGPLPDEPARKRMREFIDSV
jgi:diketogulonate reductase-like aldo/keto reductase